MIPPEQFQSLTGRLQTFYPPIRRSSPRCCFNPSQVGYKLMEAVANDAMHASFNPSQVGYKLRPAPNTTPPSFGFNPSQVGYKQR